jgi:hypothetical protein
LEYLIDKHILLVEALLVIMLFNIVVPTLLKRKRKIVSFVKWTRVGYFLFWTLWAMVIFSGLVVFMFQKAELPFDVILMIAVSFILPFLDGYRAIKQRRVWMESEFKELALKFSNTVVSIEIILLLITTLVAIKF